MEYASLIILNTIIDVDNENYYDVILADTTLQCVESRILDFEELIELREKHSKAKADFEIDNGVFKCNPVIPTINLDRASLQLLQKSCNQTKEPVINFYSLLEYGIKNNYYVYDDGVLVPFRKIHFSESTMSVYVPVISGGHIHNKMLVTAEEGRLVEHEFFVAAPKEENLIHLKCEKTGDSVEQGGLTYSIWKKCMSGLYSLTEYSRGIINQEVYESKLNRSVVSLIQDFIESLNDLEGQANEENQITWSGGNRDYTEEVRVCFKSTFTGFKVADRSEIIDACASVISQGGSRSDVFTRFAQMDKLTSERSYAISILFMIMNGRTSMPDLVSACFNARKQLQEIIFWKDLYLYKVRTRLFLEQKQIVSPSNRFLIGGCTTEMSEVIFRFT